MNLISKKDLLAITGISYGQLYRWKRERLIPEEWFIKQSAYTGQETFFPRDQILSRVKSILDLKDLYSLEELARILSPETSTIGIELKDLEKIEEIDLWLLEYMPEIFGKERLDFFEVALTATISQAARNIGLSKEQAADLLSGSIVAASNQSVTNICCTVFQTREEYHTLFSADAMPIAFDDSIQIKERISISGISDALKIKYKNLLVKS